jgi:hypothetical protein
MAKSNVSEKTRRKPRKRYIKPEGLTDEQVKEIRRKYRRGDTSTRKLGVEYGVSHVYISYLIKRTRAIT